MFIFYHKKIDRNKETYFYNSSSLLHKLILHIDEKNIKYQTQAILTNNVIRKITTRIVEICIN